MTELQARVLDRVEFVPPSACWVWTGAVFNRTTPKQIPAMKLNGKVQNVRRISFEAFVGEVWDEKLRFITLCGVDLCVNPEHVAPVDPDELCVAGRETQAARAAVMTHFACGHERTPENSIKKMRRKSSNGTVCRTCERVRKREYQIAARERDKALYGKRRY